MNVQVFADVCHRTEVITASHKRRACRRGSPVHVFLAGPEIRLAIILGFALVAFSLPVRRADAAKLGGAYFVDDAEIGRLGSCEIESWGSFAANTDRIFVFSPACVFNLGRPVELGANFVKMRSDGAWDST